MNKFSSNKVVLLFLVLASVLLVACNDTSNDVEEETTDVSEEENNLFVGNSYALIPFIEIPPEENPFEDAEPQKSNSTIYEFKSNNEVDVHFYNDTFRGEYNFNGNQLSMEIFDENDRAIVTFALENVQQLEYNPIVVTTEYLDFRRNGNGQFENSYTMSPGTYPTFIEMEDRD